MVRGWAKKQIHLNNIFVHLLHQIQTLIRYVAYICGYLLEICSVIKNLRKIILQRKKLCLLKDYYNTLNRYIKRIIITIARVVQLGGHSLTHFALKKKIINPITLQQVVMAPRRQAEYYIYVLRAALTSIFIKPSILYIIYIICIRV